MSSKLLESCSTRSVCGRELCSWYAAVRALLVVTTQGLALVRAWLMHADLKHASVLVAGGGSSVADPAALLSPAFGYTSEAIHHGVSSLLTGLRAYEAHSRLLAPWHDTFVELVQGQLQALLMQQVTQFKALAHIKVGHSMLAMVGDEL